MKSANRINHTNIFYILLQAKKLLVRSLTLNKMQVSQYKDISKFSKAIGIAPERLVQAFQIEKEFHYKILNENSPDIRKKLYAEVYETVHKIYGKSEHDINKTPNPKDGIVFMFRNEIGNKSILDIGCGEGYFLASVAKNLPFKKLVGIDISIPEKSFNRDDIQFIRSDIIEFFTEEKFDVAIADQVIEHIAPADVNTFLTSVSNSLKENGLFILLLPNPLFGPSDVTRIIDFSCTGKISAEGTHLNELTFSSIHTILSKNGFTDFKTVLQVPKLRKWFPAFRFNPGIMRFIENSKIIMWFIHRIKYKNMPLFKFETVIICKTGVKE